jgi:hypothetical protein
MEGIEVRAKLILLVVLAVLAVAFVALAVPAAASPSDNGYTNGHDYLEEMFSTNESPGADVCGGSAVESWAELHSGRDEMLGFDKRSDQGKAHCP